jgi:hypothetical protein
MMPIAAAEMPTLQPIPVTTIPAGGLVRYAIDGDARVRALRDDCISKLPRGAASLLPALDSATHRWLRRSNSPYVEDIAAIAASLEYHGVWFLNGCYQWGCTAVARDQDNAPWLARTLDWPFPGLGRRLEVVRMQGSAGDFDNVTWPGYVGILTASAAGRFAAAINQAPLRRRTRHPGLRPFDIALNALRTWRIRHIPPDHLLRAVFEIAKTYGEARARLEQTPVARPVIYTLVGCERGERCVIERTEDGFQTRDDDTTAANDWIRASWPWEARVSSETLLTRSYEEAADNSRTRREQLAGWRGQFASAGFEWVTKPVLNSNTRLAVEMCPALGRLRAVGYELMDGRELPVPVTTICEVSAVAGSPIAARAGDGHVK